MLNQRTTLSLRSSENPTNSRLIVLKPRFGAAPTAVGCRTGSTSLRDQRWSSLRVRAHGLTTKPRLYNLARNSARLEEAAVVHRSWSVQDAKESVQRGRRGRAARAADCD